MAQGSAKTTSVNQFAELKDTFMKALKSGNYNKALAIILAGSVALVGLNGYIKALEREHARKQGEKECDEKTENQNHGHSHGHGQGHGDHSHGHAHDAGKHIPNDVFSRRLKLLVPIMFPKLFGKETAIAAFLAFLLTVRTWISSLIADVSGKAAGQLVSKRVDNAILNLGEYLVLSIPASFVNSGLKFFTTQLSLAIRTNINHYLHDRYLDGVTFYNVSNLTTGGDRIDDVAERITVDVDHLTEEMAQVYTSTFKPIMDIIFFTYKLGMATTWRGPVILYSYFGLSSLCKLLATPPLGVLGARSSELEGDFRTAHERIITNSEEIAFYDGSGAEKGIINRKFDELKNHLYFQSLSRAFLSVVDNVIVKYWATLAGYLALLAPVLMGNSSGKDTAELTSDYARNLRFLENLADAIGALVLVSNKINELKGHVQRIGELIERLKTAKDNTVNNVLDNVDNAERASNGLRRSREISSESSVFLKYWKEKCDSREQKSSSTVSSTDRMINGVKVVEGDDIMFNHIDIISPDAKLLAKDVTFTVKAHQNVMITGPNGAGKSSLFRLIGELWPPYPHHETSDTTADTSSSSSPSSSPPPSSPPSSHPRSTPSSSPSSPPSSSIPMMMKPKKSSILFVPQKPYLVLGTLRDQVIYPHTKEQMLQQGITDDDLAKLLSLVDPKQHILKTWHWDQQKDWFHAFSGGQKQRVAMARLFYHRPKYAILDECTSAVSDEVEDDIYFTCKNLGITLFTVSHRKYLRKHHDFLMTIEGREGRWSWEKISH